MSKPITPAEVIKAKQEAFPDEVLDSFNELIAQNWTGTAACIRQDEIVARIISKMDVTKTRIYKEHWLDVEGIYEKAGWKVVYDKPAYNENYEASFIFSKKKA